MTEKDIEREKCKREEKRKNGGKGKEKEIEKYM